MKENKIAKLSSVAIIPARGGSKRLPRKNILDLAGRPMLHHPVRTAIKSGLFDEVIVSTEDAEVSEVARQAGARVISRDESLATDQATVGQVCESVLRSLRQEGKMPAAFCAIYATAAFITADDLIRSQKLLSEPVEADIVMGVSEFFIHPYRAQKVTGTYLEPIFPDLVGGKSQDFPDVVASNGTIYWARAEHFLKHPSFYTERLVGYKIPRQRAVDIDTPQDYEWAKNLAKTIGL